MTRRSPSSQVGVSLIELLIAMALGLILIATIGNAYVSAKQSFRTLDALSRIQEGARYAFEFIAQDVRMSGFTGGPAAYGEIAQPAGWTNTLQDLREYPLIGFDEGNGTAPAWATSRLRGDTLTVVHADEENQYALDPGVAPNCTGTTICTLTAWPNPAPAVGGYFISADYSRASAFQATAVDGGARTVSRAIDLGAMAGAIGARRLFRLRGATYYIRSNPGGEPALYRAPLGGSVEELIEGIQDMQITYGVDTTAAADGAVDAYWTANQVTAGTDGVTALPVDATYSAAAVGYWRRVLSVRVSLLMVSRADENVTGAPQRYTFNGTATTPTDGRLRKVFTHTIAVRNRL